MTSLPEHLGSGLFGLLLVNVFHQDTLVLKHVSLALHIQVVVTKYAAT